MPSPSVSPWQASKQLGRKKQVRRRRSRACSGGGDGFRWESFTLFSSLLSSASALCLLAPPESSWRYRNFDLLRALRAHSSPSWEPRNAPGPTVPAALPEANRGRRKKKRENDRTHPEGGRVGGLGSTIPARRRSRPEGKRSAGECHCPVRMKPTSPKRKIPGSAMISLDHWIGSTSFWYKLFFRGTSRDPHLGKRTRGGSKVPRSLSPWSGHPPKHCVHALLDITFLTRPLPSGFLLLYLTQDGQEKSLAFWGSQFHVLAEVSIQKDLGLGKRGVLKISPIRRLKYWVLFFSSLLG